MFIESYFKVTGDTRSEDNRAHLIDSVDRSAYMTQSLLKFAYPYMKSVKVDEGSKNAFLYPAGPVVHHSDGRNINNLLPYSEIAIKSQAGLSVFTLAKRFPNVEFDYANINGNTCASSMHSMYEAYDLLHNKRFDNVIVYAQDMVEDSQLHLFKQLGIDLICGDGLAVVQFTRERTENSIAEINGVSWVFSGTDTSPMSVSRAGYVKAIKDLGDIENPDYIKPHGTGTGRNNIEEESAIEELFGDTEALYYKKDIGHTQGASAVLETCMAIEDVDKGKSFLALASGLGGFYGAAFVRKI